MGDPILIKKYPNRRLYDTEKSTYISLSDIADVIRQGRQVKVVDVKTGEDSTAFILTQILLEEARRKNFLMPPSLLHLVIRYGETILAEFFEKYLQQTLENYLAYRQAFDENFSKWLDAGLDLSTRAGETLKDVSPVESVFRFFTNPGDARPAGKKKK